MLDTQDTKHFVRAILEKAVGYQWNLSGLGMLRLSLGPVMRLHVWDSKYKVPDVSPIHTHPWDLSSWVIAGEMRNQRFVPQASRKVYNVAAITCGAEPAPSEIAKIALAPRPTEYFREGEHYGQYANEIHESRPKDGTVTLIRRIRTDRLRDDKAYVYWESGPFVSASPRPATIAEVVDITSKALEKWF